MTQTIFYGKIYIHCSVYDARSKQMSEKSMIIIKKSMCIDQILNTQAHTYIRMPRTIFIIADCKIINKCIHLYVFVYFAKE